MLLRRTQVQCIDFRSYHIVRAGANVFSSYITSRGKRTNNVHTQKNSVLHNVQYTFNI